MKKFLATLFIACFAFTFTVGSIGCSGDKSSAKKDEPKKDEPKKDDKKDDKK